MPLNKETKPIIPDKRMKKILIFIKLEFFMIFMKLSLTYEMIIYFESSLSCCEKSVFKRNF